MVTPAPPSHAPLTIEVWSDVVCPWCYIGKRRLESATEQVRARGSAIDGAVVRWRSFQLDPSAPRPGEHGHGVGVAEHLGRKYGGGIEAGRAMSAQMTEVATGEGLDFRLDEAKVGNTADAHRLLHLAADLAIEGLQDRVKERFLKAYFTQGRDISEPSVLRDLATEAGLPQSRVEQVLSSTAYEREVGEDQSQAQALGAGGVPFTVIDGRCGVSGAQSVDVFVSAIERALADRSPQVRSVCAPASEASDAHQCGPEGCEVR